MSSGNLLFYFMMVAGPLLSVSSSSWVVCWVGIELTFLGLIPVLSSEQYFFSLSKESSMKYFCIQALGSGLLFLGGVLSYMLCKYSMVVDIVFLLSLLIKLGIFPAHFWVPSVVSGLSWYPMFLLLTWQKVPVLFLMTNFSAVHSFGEVLILLGGLSAIIGAVIGLNQSQVPPMLGASSITHGGWLMVGITYGCMWTYFFLYVVSLGCFMLFTGGGKSLMSGFSLLSLSGLPPFTMFLGKWVVLKTALASSWSSWFVFLPVLGSVMSLFYYLKFTYSFYLDSDNDSSINWGYLISFSFFILGGFFYLGVY